MILVSPFYGNKASSSSSISVFKIRIRKTSKMHREVKRVLLILLHEGRV